MLASYDNRCTITGFSMPDLLVASHIIPWSVNAKNRMNPRNGLCLNYFHDKAFDIGLISVSPEYTILVSSAIKNSNTYNKSWFLPYEGKRFYYPKGFFHHKNS